jgi:metal-responsive CopG/Arc/MetJ family transcriptional regulator
MITVQMTLNEDLVKAVDSAAKALHTNRSAFTRKALIDELDRINKRSLEKRHHQGYSTHPVKTNEFSVWEKEQAWGDA